MTNRLEKFLACKHRNIQQYTEVCLDCGENIYTTPREIREEENKEKQRKEQNWNETGW